jgi:1-deoxy-D-xylulose-5-phosphate reductoisomerase
VKLGFEAIRRGGVAGAVVNGANEAAVGAFLDGRIRLGRIVELVEDALDRTPAVDEVTLDALIEADAWAQQQVTAAVA